MDNCERCPTCGFTGPDQIDGVGDYGGGPYEARCGNEWHADKLYDCRYSRATYAQPCDRCDGSCARSLKDEKAA